MKITHSIVPAQRPPLTEWMQAYNGKNNTEKKINPKEKVIKKYYLYTENKFN